MQRQDGFRGGIQSGTVATDSFAKYLDQTMKSVQGELAEELKSQGYTCQKKFKKDFLIERGVLVGCEPDGGIWFKDGKVVAAFEGKKQGKGGNAIERWEKNYNICKTLNPDIVYVTFGAREGFEPDGYPYKYAKTMLNRESKELNTLYENGQSWFVNPNGFTREEIKEIMKQALIGK
ncbi:MAG: hypothetical protein ACO209_09515 [Aquirufa sp.]